MSDNTLPLQAAIVAALRGSAALTALGARIFDHIPDGCRQPYAAMATWTLRDEGTDCFDAQTVEFMIDCWSDKKGREEVAKIAGAVKDTLHRLAVDNAEISWNDTAFGIESEMMSRAIMRFTALLDG